MSVFNYSVLSDYEFELLCRDVMSRHLDVSLRITSKGKDKGVDITDDAANNNIVIQVKHYAISSISTLISSIKKEKNKVERIKPKEYYVCCSRDLTNSKITEIYNCFKPYMSSANNVLTESFFDRFLSEKSNMDILRKHTKLWLCSSNILELINNRDMFIDCDYLLADIDQEAKTFVQTSYYQKCRESIEKYPVLFILGAPGVGKTITTKMLALEYSKNDYKIRYLASNSISDLKEALSEDDNEKELVIMDDCLGQTYFKIGETQGKEIVSLLSYISRHQNKKIILNSRVTIYNEAMDSFQEFKDFMGRHSNTIHYINIESLTPVEKGMILYNKLYFNETYDKYRDEILNNRSYRKIVLHGNFTPRIAEYITNPNTSIQSGQFVDFALECLDNPQEIWKNEFERRLQHVDRLFLVTLFSLTEHDEDEKTVKRAFESRISRDPQIDNTIAQFYTVVNRLNHSMIKVIDKHGTRHIGVINPSVNDFLRAYIQENSNERNGIIESATEYTQFFRINDSSISERITNGTIDSIHFRDDKSKLQTILYYICRNKLVVDDYRVTFCIILSYLHKLTDITCVSNEELLCMCLSDDINNIYATRGMLTEKSLGDYLDGLSVEEWEHLLICIDKHHVEYLYDEYANLFIDALNSFFDYYGDAVYKDNYYRSIDPWDVLDDWPDLDYILKNIDVNWEYEIAIRSALEDDVERIINLLPDTIKKGFEYDPQDLLIDLDGLEEYLIEAKNKEEMAERLPKVHDDNQLDIIFH